MCKILFYHVIFLIKVLRPIHANWCIDTECNDFLAVMKRCDKTIHSKAIYRFNNTTFLWESMLKCLCSVLCKITIRLFFQWLQQEKHDMARQCITLVCMCHLPHRDAFKHLYKQEQTHIRQLFFAYGNMFRYDPTLVDLTSNFFVLCTNVKVYLIYKYS